MNFKLFPAKLISKIQWNLSALEVVSKGLIMNFSTSDYLDPSGLGGKLFPAVAHGSLLPKIFSIKFGSSYKVIYGYFQNGQRCSQQ